MNDALLYIGSGVAIVWGIAHIVPTKSVVGGFSSISEDNKRIITMEWIAGGLVLCFIGLLVLLVTAIGDTGNNVPDIVYLASSVMLLVMAVLTQLTGARTAVIPIKICPYVQTSAAILFLLGVWI